MSKRKRPRAQLIEKFPPIRELLQTHNRLSILDVDSDWEKNRTLVTLSNGWRINYPSTDAGV